VVSYLVGTFTSSKLFRRTALMRLDCEILLVSELGKEEGKLSARSIKQIPVVIVSKMSHPDCKFINEWLGRGLGKLSYVYR
jgi:hypothetical protein